MTVLHDLTAVEQRDGLRRRDVSSTELLEHYLARTARYGEELGAFTHLTVERARAEAADADRLLAAGDAEAHPPLLGLPMGFKDLHPVAGIPTRYGSAAIPVSTPAADGHTVGLLRAAGVVTVGTTRAPEFGVYCYTETAGSPPAVTPYDTSRYASGSSGGAAVAVAAGLLPAAHASDGLGSTRSPAGVCGLVGVKATRGRVSRWPTTSFESWGSEGPLARTVEDAALLLDVMAQPPAGDLHALPRETSFLDASRRDPGRPLRVLLQADVWTGTAPHPESLLAVERTAALLEGLGHHVEVGVNPCPFDDVLLEALQTVVAVATAAAVQALVPPERRGLLRPFSAWCQSRGSATPAVEHLLATGQVARAASAHLAAAGPHDVVLTPVTDGPAVPVGWFGQEGAAQEGRRMLAWCGALPWVNWTGLPAVALPLHRTAEGLPLGVQLVASRHGEDALLLSLAGQLERAAPFAHLHPPQW